MEPPPLLTQHPRLPPLPKDCIMPGRCLDYCTES